MKFFLFWKSFCSERSETSPLAAPQPGKQLEPAAIPEAGSRRRGRGKGQVLPTLENRKIIKPNREILKPNKGLRSTLQE